MKKILFLIAFITISAQSLNIKTIDLTFDEDNFYRIKNIDSDLKFYFNNITNVNLLPKKYINLIIMILKNKKIFYRCDTKSIVINKITYEFNFCEKYPEIQDIKMELNFDIGDFNISLSELKIFSVEEEIYYFNFWTNDYIQDVTISSILINSNMRLLESENDEDKVRGDDENSKNNNNNSENDSNQKINKLNNNKSKIGWIGICSIILLSIIIIYILYVVFRYYRRKKYQNPSFYYRITEEMFDDITPIE